MKLAELYVEIAGNDGRLQKTIGAIPKSFAPIAAAVAGLGIGAGLAALVSKSSEVSSHFETMGVALSNATDLAGPELKKLQGEIEALGLSLSGVSLDSLYGIATNAAKAGVAGPGLVSFAEGVAKLSVALDDIPADVIVDQLIKINSSFNLPIPTLANLGAAIDKLADSGTSNAADIFNASGRLAGIGKAAGLSVNEVLALNAAALETGASAEQASGSIGRFISALASDRGTEYFADRMKISLEQAKEQIAKKPLEAMSAFLKSIEGKGLNEASVALKEIGLGGSEDVGVLLNLAGKMKQVGEYSELAAEQIKTGSQALESYAKAAATSDSGSVRLQNAIDITYKKIGEALGPALNKINEIIADLVVNLSQSESSFEKLAAGAQKFADGIANAIEEIKIMQDLSLKDNLIREWNLLVEAVGLDRLKVNESAIDGKIAAGRSGGGVKLGADGRKFLKEEKERVRKEAEEEANKAKKPEEKVEKKVEVEFNFDPSSLGVAMDEIVKEFKEEASRQLLDPDGILSQAGIDFRNPDELRAWKENLEGELEELSRRPTKGLEIQGVEDRLRSAQISAGEEYQKTQTRLQEASVELLGAISSALEKIERKEPGARLG